MFRALFVIAIFKFLGMLFRLAWRSTMFIIGVLLHLVAFLIRAIEAKWKQSASCTHQTASIAPED